MIGFPLKRIYGLVGAPRDGKNSVATFLEETRGFVSFAFADQIKEEYGINKEDFESAKISGNIEDLRKELWKYSDSIKKKDPFYFIRALVDKVNSVSSSVVVTDIRTEDELFAISDKRCSDDISKIYFIYKNYINESFKNNMLVDSKLSKYRITSASSKDIYYIFNENKGIYRFYQYLDDFFAREDLKDLPHDENWHSTIDEYLKQFEFKQRKV